MLRPPLPRSEAGAVLRREAWSLAEETGYDAIVDWIGDASLVLLGESTHGTHEFYAARAALTQRLIQRRGFSAIAIEGDWPDAYQVHRYIQDPGPGRAGDWPRGAFQRFPSWMWRNEDVAQLVGWLRQHNAAVPDRHRRVGFYGLDLYSLHDSMREVVRYLDERDPVAARAARLSYSCFDQFGSDSDEYAWAGAHLGAGTCEEAVTAQLRALHEQRGRLIQPDGACAEDEFFSAEQNARLARNAERYYRTMFHGRVASWNLRDRHMAETLEELLAHLRRRGQPAKVVVWAHNSHLGDARATEMGDAGELNLGQLVRERHGHQSRLIGCTTTMGTVLAASQWGASAERQRVRPALAGSCEDLLHDTALPRFFLPLAPGGPAHALLAKRRLERAIGVVYRPASERRSHYFEAQMAAQFDAVLHVDETQAVVPLDEALTPAAIHTPETDRRDDE